MQSVRVFVNKFPRLRIRDGGLAVEMTTTPGGVDLIEQARYSRSPRGWPSISPLSSWFARLLWCREITMLNRWNVTLASVGGLVGDGFFDIFQRFKCSCDRSFGD
jgi:hypothetical protein